MGERSTAAFVVFEDPEVKPLRVRLRAYVDPEYRVVIQPRLLTLPSTAGAGDAVEHDIEVTEFTTSLGEFERGTTIASTNPDRLDVLAVSPWNSMGWQYTGGYARTAVVRVRARVPAEWRGTNLAPVSLIFSKETPDSEGPRRTREVPLGLSKI